MASVSSNLREVLDPKEKMEGDEEEQEEELEENLDNSSLEDSQDQDLRMSLALSPASSSNHMVGDGGKSLNRLKWMTPFKIGELGPMFSTRFDTEMKKRRVALQREKSLSITHTHTRTHTRRSSTLSQRFFFFWLRSWQSLLLITEKTEVYFLLQELPPRAVSKMSERRESAQESKMSQAERFIEARPRRMEDLSIRLSRYDAAS
ncbi:hypothetical protein GBF38_005079, partial [Nibea albiflora]